MTSQWMDYDEQQKWMKESYKTSFWNNSKYKSKTEANTFPLSGT